MVERLAIRPLCVRKLQTSSDPKMRVVPGARGGGGLLYGASPAGAACPWIFTTTATKIGWQFAT